MWEEKTKPKYKVGNSDPTLAKETLEKKRKKLGNKIKKNAGATKRWKTHTWKQDDPVIHWKIEVAAKLGCTNEQICKMAWISHPTYLSLLKNYPELAIKVQQNKLEPLQYALNSVIKALKNWEDYRFALDFLKSAYPEQYGTKKVIQQNIVEEDDEDEEVTINLLKQIENKMED